jgi:hypothetical protein
MNIAGFRGKRLHTSSLRNKAIKEAADDEVLKQLRDMAITDPSKRATAADILRKVFNGEGCITRRGHNHAAETGSNKARPVPAKQRTKLGKVATAEIGLTGSNKIKQRLPRNQVAPGGAKRSRLYNLVTEKQLLS